MMKLECRDEQTDKVPRRAGAGTYSSPCAMNASAGTRPSLPATALHGFSLVELLVVIAIIAALASMIIPVAGAVNRAKVRSKARTELEQVATAIDMYKAKLGHYPPDNPRKLTTNQLYFELLGTIFTNGVYTTLDGSAQVRATAIPSVYGPDVGGFVNTTQGTGGDEARTAASFLNGLKPGQAALITSGADQVRLLASSIFAAGSVPIPFSYNSSSPTNNPSTYDLWVDILINGKTNRINNWSKEPLILP